MYSFELSITSYGKPLRTFLDNPNKSQFWETQLQIAHKRWVVKKKKKIMKPREKEKVD